jgi:hypothetical protein
VNSVIIAAAVEEFRRAEDSLDPDLDHDPPGIDPRGPVALRIAQFGVADRLGVGVDRGPTLQ